MSTEVICVIGYVIAALSLVSAFMAWQKASGLNALVKEAATHYEAARKTLQKQEKDLIDGREKAEQQRATIAKLEKHLEEARSKFAGHNRELQEQKDLLVQERSRFELKQEHLTEQVAVLMEQLKAAEQLRKIAEDEARQARVEADKQNRSAKAADKEELQKLKAELAESRKSAKKLQNDVDRMRTILTKVDPAENRKNKQRVTKLEQLYTSMKGLREMAEERNHNWEVALRKLAAYIVGMDEADAQGRPTPIGPLVGAALERVGGHLVEDELTVVPPSTLSEHGEATRHDL